MARSQSWVFFSIALHLIFLSQGPSLNLELGDWLDWLASKPQGSSSFCHRCMPLCPALRYVLGLQNWVLMLVQQAFYSLSHLPAFWVSWLLASKKKRRVMGSFCFLTVAIVTPAWGKLFLTCSSLFSPFSGFCKVMLHAQLCLQEATEGTLT